MSRYYPVLLLVALVAVTAVVGPAVTESVSGSVDAPQERVAPGRPRAAALQQADGTNDSSGSIDVTELDAPDSARIGTTVEVEAVLENDGDERATRTVQFIMAGNRYGLDEVTLDPGEQTTVSFEQNTMGIGLEADQYYTGVLVGDHGEMDPLTLTRGFDIDEIRAPETVTAGENFTMTASVKNYDGFDDTQRIEYRLDGEVLAAKPFSLEGTEERQFNISVDTSGVDAGTYVHGLVANGTGSHGTITIASPEETDGE